MPQYIHTPTLRYPITEQDIRGWFPNTSFPVPFVPPSEYAVVFPSPQPTFDPIIRAVREVAPVLTSKGTWEQRWTVVPRFVEYTDAQGVTHTVAQQEAAAMASAQEQRQEQLKRSIVDATQARLDAFAQTRGYDNIQSAASYAGCRVPQFSREGTYCRDAMALTWAALYELQARVEAGERPAPGGFPDIEPDLPTLVWPE